MVITLKNQIQWLSLVAAFIISIAGSLGCATMAASSVGSGNDNSFYFKPVLTDEIVAIGKPDKTLSKELGQDHAVAFIGLKNTYMLYKGGEELEAIARLNLDSKRMDIDAARSHKLYKKDHQVWGELVLTYGRGEPISTEEQAQLNKGGFYELKGSRNNQFQTRVNIEGVIYPAIKLSGEQMSKLETHRAFNLYHSRDEKPPVIGKILKLPLVAVGVAADVALVPVYIGILGITSVFVIGAAISN